MNKQTKNILLIGGGLAAVYFLFVKKSAAVAPRALPGSTPQPATASGNINSLLSSVNSLIKTITGKPTSPTSGQQQKGGGGGGVSAGSGGGGGGGAKSSAPLPSNTQTSSGAQTGNWNLSSDGSATRTNADGSTDTQVPGSSFYVEKDASGNTTLYDAHGNEQPQDTWVQDAQGNEVRINSDGTVDNANGDGTFTETDASGNATVYDGSGNDITEAYTSGSYDATASTDAPPDASQVPANALTVDPTANYTDPNYDPTADGSFAGPVRMVKSQLVNFPQLSPTPASIMGAVIC